MIYDEEIVDMIAKYIVANPSYLEVRASKNFTRETEHTPVTRVVVSDNNFSSDEEFSTHEIILTPSGDIETINGQLIPSAVSCEKIKAAIREVFKMRFKVRQRVKRMKTDD